MKYYFYTVRYDSNKRGFNRTITVYGQNRDKGFSRIGRDEEINTASYMGDYAVACAILNKEKGHKLSKASKWQGAGYELESENIKLIELPR